MAGLPVSIAVEGASDAAVAARLLRWVGLEPGPVFGQAGKSRIDRRVQQYNRAALHGPWLVIRDLNSDADCAPEIRRRLLPAPSPRMVFRVAVRAIEAWLLADRVNLGTFLNVAVAKIPTEPDAVIRPKRLMVDLARQSRSRSIREEMLPAPGTTALVGPGYTGRLVEFSVNHWDPEAAAGRSDSLRRCIAALRRAAVTIRRPTSVFAP